MENEIFFASATLRGEEEISLDYYMVCDSIGGEYCNLMGYGVRVEKTVLKNGGGKIVDSKQINNIFYSRAEAEKFLKLIVRNGVSPITLMEVVEDYIISDIA